jgi:DNA primase
VILQHPHAVVAHVADLGSNDFIHPVYRGVWELIAGSGGPAAATDDWLSRLRDSGPSPEVSSALSALAVEPLPRDKEPDDAYVAAHIYRLQELTAARRIAQLKSKLQRTNPVSEATAYNRMFGELVALEQHRRRLRERAVGVS